MNSPVAAPTAVVVGGGPCGLAAAMALAGRGWSVHLLDGNAPPPEGRPAKAAENWVRPGVPQSAHSHTLTSLGVRTLRKRAPQLLAAALDEGALLLDVNAAAPQQAAAGAAAPQPPDPDLRALAIRRTVLDLVLYRAAERTPGVFLRHGAVVRGLMLDASARRVRGVVTAGGERVGADVVVDAGGRGAASRSWLAAAGVPTAADLTGGRGVRGFTRFYRLPEPGGLPGPLNRGNAAGGIWEQYAAVAHPADNGTFALTLAVPAYDRRFAALLAPDAFLAAARLSPFLAPWADAAAEPIGAVRSTTLPQSTLRGTVTGQQRPVAGLFALGDAACVTDPLFGRGLSLALAHAFALADLLPADEAARGRAAGTGGAMVGAMGGAVGEEHSVRAAELVGKLLHPWFEQSVYDEAVLARLWRAGDAPADERRGADAAQDGLGADRDGRPHPSAVPAEAPEPDSATKRPQPPVPGRPPLTAVSAAARGDAVVRRGLIRVLMTLDTPALVLDDEAFRARVHAAAGAAGAAGGVAPPTREELLDAATTAAGGRP